MEENNKVTNEIKKKKFFTKERIKTMAIVLLSFAVLGSSSSDKTNNTIQVSTDSDVLTSQISSLTNQNEKLENSITTYTNTISNLNDKNKSLEEKIQKLEKENSKLESEKNNLQNQISSLTSKNNVSSSNSSSSSNSTSKRKNSSTDSTTSNSSRTVYITKTGSKYHSSSCSYLKRSKIAISLKDAKDRGYSACSRCNP